MTSIDFSILSLLLFVPLVVLITYIFYTFRIRLQNDLLVSLVRLIAQLGITGLYLTLLYQYQNMGINLAWFVIMAGVAVFWGIRQQRLLLKNYFLTVFIALITSVLTMSCYVLMAVFGIENPFQTVWFIPMTAWLITNSYQPIICSMGTFRQEINQRTSIYHYLLGNGAGKIEALSPYMQTVAKKTIHPMLQQITTMSMASLPNVLIGMLFFHTEPLLLVKIVAALVLSTLITTLLGIAIALTHIYLQIFDKEGRLRKKKETEL